MTVFSPSARSSRLVVGPLLRDVLEAQDLDERVVSYPALRGFAIALVRTCRELNSPLIWPIGEAAERLAGGAVLLGKGDVRVRGWSDDVRDDHVLLVVVAAVSIMTLTQAARHVRARGASEVHACAVQVGDSPRSADESRLDSYRILTTASPLSGTPTAAAASAAAA